MVKQKIDLNRFKSKNNREWTDMGEFVLALRKNVIVWCWAAEDWQKISDCCLRFTVNGHHHSGHVYIYVAPNDTFEVYITTDQGVIKDVFKNVYIQELVTVIDERVESIGV